MMEELSVSTLMGIVGLVIGLGLGAVIHRTNFCAMGAVSDIISFGDWKRMRAWALAAAVAMLGTQALYLAGP
ncbi:MAG TPA: YeeE/YedE family protein, partial [Thermopetrobacter sp.]|nr:YeeE/YedE family protein [Thermopetrobacter sp.]